MDSIEYKYDNASKENIAIHLNRCNLLFTPRLDSYVDIDQYAGKIRNRANTFEAWVDNKLVGLVACYLNNKETQQGYITNVSVLKEFQQKGIANALLGQTIKEALAGGFKTLSLEVGVNNKNAIRLYQDLGFVLSERNGNTYTMINRMHENKNVMVSICCITYNHEKYIRKAIEGFLMQKVAFTVEILIHDDASTDDTANIIKEYEKKFPDIVKPIYQTENQHQQGRPISLVYQFPRARGKYIALCEGDDYWIDPYKLQKQVDFLEKNPKYGMCFHNYLFYYQEENKYTHDNVFINSDFDFDFQYYWNEVIHHRFFTRTLTCVFLKEMLNNIDFNLYHYIKDFSLYYLFLKQKPAHVLGDQMGIYRVHRKSVWNGRSYFLNLSHNFNERSELHKNNRDEYSRILLKDTLIEMFKYSLVEKDPFMSTKFIGLSYKELGLFHSMKILYREKLISDLILRPYYNKYFYQNIKRLRRFIKRLFKLLVIK
ncbi:MAG: GNAT family N-acetyltransferase [Mangrovibacterium sp.]